MSTKAIRSALQVVREDKYPALYAEALAELEAIEKAAMVLAKSSIGYMRKMSEHADVDAAHALQKTIAAQRNGGTTGAPSPSVAGASGPQE